MAKVSLHFGRLARVGYKPAEIVRMAQALEAAGIHVNLQIQDPEGMKLLGQLPALQTQQERQFRLSMIRLLVVGVLMSLVPLLYGALGLLQ